MEMSEIIQASFINGLILGLAWKDPEAPCLVLVVYNVQVEEKQKQLP